MKRKSTFVLILLLCSAWIVSLNVGKVQAQGTIYNIIVEVSSPIQNKTYFTNDIPLSFNYSANIDNLPNISEYSVVFCYNLDGEPTFDMFGNPVFWGNTTRIGQFDQPIPLDHNSSIHVPNGNHSLFVFLNFWITPEGESQNTFDVPAVSQVVNFTVSSPTPPIPEFPSEVKYTPETNFSIPEFNGQVNFSIGGIYESAKLENGTWNFVGLALDSYMYDLGNTYSGGIVRGSEYLRFCPNDGNFSVSVKNCNITITNLDLITRFAPFSGWINYSVNGVGNQSLNLHYILSDGSCIGPDLWTICIDGIPKPQNEGWTISWSPEQIITISGATKNVSIYFDSTIPPKDDDDKLPPFDIFIKQYGGLVVLALLFVIIVTLSLYWYYTKRKQKQRRGHE